MTDSLSSHQLEKQNNLYSPPLPESFIPRPDPFNRLKGLLTDPSERHTVVLSSRDGLGGMGKTSLALALIEDQTIRDSFVDGVLWANLGPDPDILTPLLRWLTMLGAPALDASTVTMASAQLRHWIKRRRLLLIVDEVYSLADLAPFQVVQDTDCRLLVTSRELDVPQAASYELTEMSAAQSQQFFETQLKRSLEQKNKKDALQFAKSVGYLPLSLNLGVLQVKTGTNWSDLLTSLMLDRDVKPTAADPEGEQSRVRRMGLALPTFQPFWDSSKTREQQHQVRQNCMRFCLERLTTELRLRFASLGLFPRNVAITPQMAAMIWGLPAAESLQKLLSLKQHGFLTPGEIDAETGPSYHLHPVMRDMARWLISLPQDSAMPGLGLSWATAHQQFLERYRPLLSDGQWHTLPDDGYIHTHLLWHLEQAGWRGEIHQLLQAFNLEGRNAWYDVCDRLKIRSNFAIDLARAWQLATQLYEEAPEHSTGLQVRYGLTAAFVRQAQFQLQASERSQSLTEDLDPSQARLSEDWAFTKVLLKAARYLPDLATKVIKSTFYPSTLTRKFKEQTIFELLQNVHQESPDMALELADHLLSKAPAINALIRLTPERPSFCLPLLRLLQPVTDDRILVSGVSCLAKIGEHKLHPELYSMLPKMAHPLDRLLILEQLQPRLPDQLQPKAIAYRQTCIQALYDRDSGIGILDLAEEPNGFPLDAATMQFLKLHRYSGSAIALCYEDSLSEKLDTVYAQAVQSRSEEKQSTTLSFLLPKLSDAQRENVWLIANRLSDPECKARLLSRLLPFQPDALAALLTLLKLFENQTKLDILIQCLPGPDEILAEIYATLLALRKPEDRWSYFVQILPHIKPDQSARLVEVIQDTPFQAEGITRLLQHLTPEQAPIATGILDLVESIPPVFERATALNQVVPFLPQASHSQALDIAQEIQFPYARVMALQNLIPQFPEVAQDAMQALRNCHEDSPDDLFEALIPVLPMQDCQDAIALIGSIPDDVSRLRRLIRTLPYHASLIDDIKALLNNAPELFSHCTLEQVLIELVQVCEADLSDTNPNPPQTLHLIGAMLPLIDWVYSPAMAQGAESSGNRFCTLIEQYLDRETQTRSGAIEPSTVSQFLDFFCLIPREERRAEILEAMIQRTMSVEKPSSHQWMRWLEKLSRYRPDEFHWVLSSILPILMSFSDSNTLNQILQSIRTVREQWHARGNVENSRHP